MSNEPPQRPLDKGTHDRAVAAVERYLQRKGVKPSAVRDLVMPAHAQSQPPVPYQYKVVRSQELLPPGDNTEAKMVNAVNRFGSLGWRLAAIESSDRLGASLYYFEKPLPSTAASPAPAPLPAP